MDELFNRDKLLNFWPSKKQQPKERVLSAMRFVIYTTVILFLIRQDKRIILLGAGILFVLYMMYSNGMIKPSEVDISVEEMGIPSTSDNFMGNELMQNYTVGPNTGIPSNSEQIWDQVHPFMEDKKFSQHNFYKVPNNNIRDLLTTAYPSMFQPTCRDDNSVCDQTTRPDWINSRGPVRRNNGLY